MTDYTVYWQVSHQRNKILMTWSHMVINCLTVLTCITLFLLNELLAKYITHACIHLRMALFYMLCMFWNQGTFGSTEEIIVMGISFNLNKHMLSWDMHGLFSHSWTKHSRCGTTVTLNASPLEPLYRVEH